MGILANPLSTDPASVDLLSPSLYERGVPHDVFRHLREHEPLSFRRSAFAGPKDPGYWLLTRHADVHSVLLDTSSYSSYRGGTNLLDESPDQLDAGRMMLINMDPPNHTRYRRLITRSFAARAVADLEPHVRTLCTQVVDNIIDRGQCEFVRDVASQVPMQVIFMLLGVPEQDWAYLCELTDTMMNNGGTEAAMGAVLKLYMYSDELASRRRQSPGADMVSLLLTSEVNGELLSQAEFNAFFLLLVVAGNETTRNLIAGGMLALIEHPEELAKLQQDPSLVPSAVEEMLRFVSPVIQFRRTANRDIELYGQKIREGDRVIVAHTSANRDERVFANPDSFSVTRSPNPHLAFGVGVHLCLGATLARLEARCMFDELLRRITAPEVSGPVVRMHSNLVNGYKQLPLCFRPR